MIVFLSHRKKKRKLIWNRTYKVLRSAFIKYYKSLIEGFQFYSFIYFVICFRSLVHSFIHPSTRSTIYLFNNSFTHSVIKSLNQNNRSIHSIFSFISFTHSFNVKYTLRGFVLMIKITDSVILLTVFDISEFCSHFKKNLFLL